MSEKETAATEPEAAIEDPYFSAPNVGAIAHLYRGEVYRSTIWRTRLDATTNWSVVSLGLALSISYSSPEASALPLLLVSALIVVFLYLEARRYRYFNVWRARARWMEINFYAPMLRHESYNDEGKWQKRLSEDYVRPEHHISFKRAMGRRLRRNYLWIFFVQGSAFFGKLAIHPTPMESFSDILLRMHIGLVPGWIMFSVVVGLYVGLIGFTWRMYCLDQERFRKAHNPISMG